jgi:hypothetical protein
MLAPPGWDAVVCGGFRRVAAWPGSGFPNTGLTGAAWLKYFISSYGYLAILLLMAVEPACAAGWFGGEAAAPVSVGSSKQQGKA